MVIRIKLLLKKLCFVSIGILKERMTSLGVHSFTSCKHLFSCWDQKRERKQDLSSPASLSGRYANPAIRPTFLVHLVCGWIEKCHSLLPNETGMVRVPNPVRGCSSLQ